MTNFSVDNKLVPLNLLVYNFHELDRYVPSVINKMSSMTPSVMSLNLTCQDSGPPATEDTVMWMVLCVFVNAVPMFRQLKFDDTKALSDPMIR